MELGPFGLSELLFIAVLALIVFGPRRLPEVGHAIGRMTAKLRRATSELKSAWESELDEDSRKAMREASRQLMQVRDDLSAAGREAWREGSATTEAAAAEARRALSGLTPPRDPPAPPVLAPAPPPRPEPPSHPVQTSQPIPTPEPPAPARHEPHEP